MSAVSGMWAERERELYLSLYCPDSFTSVSPALRVLPLSLLLWELNLNLSCSALPQSFVLWVFYLNLSCSESFTSISPALRALPQSLLLWGLYLCLSCSRRNQSLVLWVLYLNLTCSKSFISLSPALRALPKSLLLSELYLNVSCSVALRALPQSLLLWELYLNLSCSCSSSLVSPSSSFLSPPTPGTDCVIKKYLLKVRGEISVFIQVRLVIAIAGLYFKVKNKYITYYMVSQFSSKQ